MAFIYISVLSFKSSYALLGLHFLASLFLPHILLIDFGPSFTQTLSDGFQNVFVDLLAFCKILVLRFTSSC